MVGLEEDFGSWATSVSGLIGVVVPSDVATEASDVEADELKHR